MDKFNLIGVRILENSELNHTRYFEIGNLKEAIEYAKGYESCGYTYHFICCDKYGNYLCEL